DLVEHVANYELVILEVSYRGSTYTFVPRFQIEALWNDLVEHIANCKLVTLEVSYRGSRCTFISRFQIEALWNDGTHSVSR
ncbi:hypothetical protein, partial [Vibrio breoganii]|uniref:hypothetical protein n=1 Tax=Vibrio breoganii TaxID=553239 RepID=UPI001A7E1A30